MKVVNYVWVCVLCVFSVDASVQRSSVIYGLDNRVEPYERPHIYRESRAVAAMVSAKNLSVEAPTGYKILANTQKRQFNFCDGTKFENQPAYSDCSGFLAAPDIIITAGHCMTSLEDCRNYKWVFGYEMRSPEINPTELAREDVYSCEAILSKPKKGEDYAVIKLDRPTEMPPLRLAPEGVMAEAGIDIYMMGHPFGLPLKITEEAQILSNSRHLHITNLDAFSGNSGSPVLDRGTNEVIGILVSGANDIKHFNGCTIFNELQMGQGEEKVTSIGIVPRYFQ